MPKLFDLSDQESGAPQLEGVGFWLRALARGIDMLVHFAVGFATGSFAALLVAVGAAIFEGDAEATIERLFASNAWGYPLSSVLGSTWMHVGMEGLHGSTIGKRLCGITVVREDGGPAGLAAALRRSVAFFVDALFFGLVGSMKMRESPQRQRIGDVWAHTVVVRISALERPARRSGLRFALAAAMGLLGNALVMLIGLASGLL